VNRVSDLDGSPGLDLIRTLKADPELAGFPVMLVSDLARAQTDAEAEGALPGFGKSDLNTDLARDRLTQVLGSH
jgi:two-component system chemotaxis response regulator CheY